MVSAISAFSGMFYANRSIDAGNNLLNNAHAMNLNVAAASRRALAFGSLGFPVHSMARFQRREKALMASNLQNSLIYKISSAQEDALAAKEKKEQQRKLDLMA